MLDHDDTTVSSTPCIHYPAFLEAMATLRPQVEPADMDGFFALSYHPGFFAYYRDVLKLTDEEMDREVKIWRSYVDKVIPPAFPGMKEIITDIRAAGGVVCVVSHSAKDIIRREYAANFGFQPDGIYGLEDGFEKMKPSPWPLDDISRRFGVDFSEMVMVDDLKPGLEMAKSRGVEFIAAGWAHSVPELAADMRKNADHYAESVAELRKLLFE